MPRTRKTNSNNKRNRKRPKKKTRRKLEKVVAHQEIRTMYWIFMLFNGRFN